MVFNSRDAFQRNSWFITEEMVFVEKDGDETRLSGTYQRERDITPRFLFCSFVTRVCAFTRDGRLCPPGFRCLVFDSFSARWHGSPWILLMRWVLLALWRERHPLLEYLFCVLEFYTRSGFLGWYWFSRYGPLRPISCHSAKQRLHLFMDDLDRGDIRWTSSSGYRARGRSRVRFWTVTSLEDICKEPLGGTLFKRFPGHSRQPVSYLHSSSLTRRMRESRAQPYFVRGVTG